MSVLVMRVTCEDTVIPQDGKGEDTTRRHGAEGDTMRIDARQQRSRLTRPQIGSEPRYERHPSQEARRAKGVR